MFPQHKEGTPFTLGIGAGVVALVALVAWWGPLWLTLVLAALSLGFWLLVLNFFRNPPRTIPPAAQGLVLAPCDGKVVVVEETHDPTLYGGRCIQLSIFMSPLNVHVSRAPVAGAVQQLSYRPGKYLVAWHPKSSTDNEQTHLLLLTPQGLHVGCKQIAGAVARRIKWYVQPGQALAAGQEYGFIRFGSRMDVLLPVGSQVRVTLGQTTRGGETVLALLPTQSPA